MNFSPIPNKPEVPSCYEFIDLGEGRILFNDLLGQQQLVTNVPDFFKDLCELTDGSRTLPELRKQLTAKRAKNITTSEITETLLQLNEAQLLVPSLKDRFCKELDETLFQRFKSTVENLDLFSTEAADGVEFFRRLRNSKVTIIGLGGNGSLAAMMLAAGGVGSLQLVDGDTVASSNLVRQIFYTETQAETGMTKAKALQNTIQGLNPHTKVEIVSEYVRSKDHLTEISKDSDFILVTADQPRMLINEWLYEVCFSLKISGMASLNGMLGPMYRPGMDNPFIKLKAEINQTLDGHYDQVVSELQKPRHRDYPSFVTGPIWLGCLQADEVFGELTGAWKPRSLGRAVFVNKCKFKEIKLGGLSV